MFISAKMQTKEEVCRMVATNIALYTPHVTAHAANAIDKIISKMISLSVANVSEPSSDFEALELMMEFFMLLGVVDLSLRVQMANYVVCSTETVTAMTKLIKEPSEQFDDVLKQLVIMTDESTHDHPTETVNLGMIEQVLRFVQYLRAFNRSALPLSHTELLTNHQFRHAWECIKDIWEPLQTVEVQEQKFLEFCACMDETLNASFGQLRDNLVARESFKEFTFHLAEYCIADYDEAEWNKLITRLLQAAVWPQQLNCPDFYDLGSSWLQWLGRMGKPMPVVLETTYPITGSESIRPKVVPRRMPYFKSELHDYEAGCVLVRRINALSPNPWPVSVLETFLCPHDGWQTTEFLIQPAEDVGGADFNYEITITSIGPVDSRKYITVFSI